MYVKHNRLQQKRLGQALLEKWLETTEGHDKEILQHENDRPHVPVKVKKLTGNSEIVGLTPDLASGDYWLFRRMQCDLEKSKSGQMEFENYQRYEKM